MKSEFEKLFKAQRSYRSSDKEAFIRGCEAAYKHQQSKVDELLTRLDERWNESWSSWKEKADMYEQGAANAFEEAYQLLEQTLKGGD